MRITFVLPGVVLEPSGGAKIVYQYANQLVARGHSVSVVHPRTWEPLSGTLQAFKSVVWPHVIRFKQGGPIPWMTVDPRVNQLLVPDLRSRFLPDADVVIATFFRTAPPVNLLPASKGRKYYFLQHYEDWAGPAVEVDATWRLPMHKIAISVWLMEIAKRLGVAGQTSHVPNAMDLQLFRLTQPIVGRRKRVVMLANSTPFKGLSQGLEALDEIKKLHPDLEAVCFGTAPRYPEIPAWIDYHSQPSSDALVEIYNSGSVFLQPSLAEGWGLTSTEAMACGCALVSTDNGGSRDYAVDGETALVVPPGDAAALSDAVVKLLNDEGLRTSLATAGNRYVQRYSWSNATDQFESALSST